MSRPSQDPSIRITEFLDVAASLMIEIKIMIEKALGCKDNIIHILI